MSSASISNAYNSVPQMQQPYSEVHPAHMSAATAHAPSSAPATSYSYPHPAPLLQPGPQFQPGPSSYTPYGYQNGVPSHPLPASSSMSNALVPQPLALPAMSAAAPTSSIPGSQTYAPHTFDHTGQVAPPGMKPRVTATLWEDEGSLCFQVEAKGVCVARREDNHFINGTKLLNVAGMTRGRRDGILKSEKTRHVVKIGPMHLKGVWIPFDRALEFANKEKITEQLYPLFVHDIGALLYHPTNSQPRGSIGAGGAGMAALDRNRRPDPMQTTRYLTGPSPPSQPPMHHQQPHSQPQIASSTMAPMSQSLYNPMPTHASAGRPGLERAHTFPTPPTSASSTMGVGSQNSSYEWGSSNVQNMQNNQPLSIDTGLSNARSVPATPASTPPGTVQTGMSYPTAQGYDSSRQMYSSGPPAQYNPQQQPMMGYRPPVQDNTYPKPEMAPPNRAPIGAEQQDVKPAEGIINQNHEQAPHPTGEEEPEHENENEYTHTNSSYAANRNAYAYNTGPAPTALHAEPAHLSPEMTGSPHQNGGSGRATPRTTATSQAQWSSGYGTPQRQPTSSSALSYVISDNQPSTNGNPAPESYHNPNSVNQYASRPYAATNGSTGTLKRGRDEDDDQDSYGRSNSQTVSGEDIDGLKRRRTMTEGSVGGPVVAPYSRNPNPGIQRARTAVTQRPTR